VSRDVISFELNYPCLASRADILPEPAPASSHFLLLGLPHSLTNAASISLDVLSQAGTAAIFNSLFHTCFSDASGQPNVRPRQNDFRRLFRSWCSLIDISSLVSITYQSAFSEPFELDASDLSTCMSSLHPNLRYNVPNV